MKILFYLAICLTVFSCTTAQRYKVGRALPGKAFASFKDALKDSSPDFQRGWADGCEVGAANGSVNTFYQMLYRSNAMDGYARANSADYRTAWGNAFWYCVRYEYIKQKSSIWGSVFGGYY